jgi:hypothetical protein
VRIRSVDEIIMEHVLLGMSALRRAEPQISPVDSAPDEMMNKTAIWRNVLAKYLSDQKAALTAEAELLANFVFEFGMGVMKIDWRRTYRMVPTEFDAGQLLDSLMQMVGQAAMQAAEMRGAEMTPEEAQLLEQKTQEMFMDMMQPEQRQKLEESLKQFLPDCPDAEAARLARELPRKGTGTYYAIRPEVDQPRFTALIPFVNLLFPPNTTRSLDEAAWVAEIHTLDSVALALRSTQENWDPEFVEKVKAGGGKIAWSNTALPDWAFTGVSGGGIDVALSVDTFNNGTEAPIYQIIELWHQGVSKGGIVTWYRTIMAHGVDCLGSHEATPYDHLCHPYVEIRREKCSPILSQSRGIGNIGVTNQQEIKVQVDTRTDNAALKANPPILTTGINSTFSGLAPGKIIPNTAGFGGFTKNGLEPIVWPTEVGTSVEIETSATARMNAFFFRGVGVDPDVKRLYWEHVTMSFLDGWTLILQKCWRLIQQYVDEVTATSIAGVPVSLAADRTDLAGNASILFDFEPGDLSMEMLDKKLNWAAKLLVPLDRGGLIDHAKLIKKGFASMGMADVVMDANAAAQNEIREEMNALAQIVAGQEPDVPENANAELRLELIQGTYQKSPLFQQYAQNEQVQAVLEGRIKKLQFQIQQRKNAIIGRQGGGEVLGE